MRIITNPYLILFSIFFILVIQAQAHAQSVYIVKEAFTIPWGDEPGEFSREWLDPDYDCAMPPGPFAISSVSGFVFANYTETERRITKYSIDGNFIAAVSYDDIGISWPHCISIADSGKVLIGSSDKLVLLNQNLQLMSTINLPRREAFVSFLWPSSNGFWCTYKSVFENIYIYLSEVHLDGTITEPVLLFTGSQTDPAQFNYYFVTPDGQTSSRILDMYGYKYNLFPDYHIGHILDKISPQGDVIYTYILNDDPGIKGYTEYCITWAGDFYTIRGTANGEVLTKFELNLAPICSLVVVTPIPLQPKPAPFAVEFDASGTTDPNGDELSYEWSFDGDLIFNEPVDDAYTGDPDHPTHLYYEDYNGPVIVRVKDPYDGECQTSVTILIDIE